jgi:hypothetical protein
MLSKRFPAKIPHCNLVSPSQLQLAQKQYKKIRSFSKRAGNTNSNKDKTQEQHAYLTTKTKTNVALWE